MIQLVMKPEKAPVVDHEGLYGMYMDGHLLLHVRARNARHAEEKVKFLMERETKGKTLDFNLEEHLEKESEDGKTERDVEKVLQPGRAEGLPAGHDAGGAGDAVGADAVHNDVKGE